MMSTTLCLTFSFSALCFWTKSNNFRRIFFALFSKTKVFVDIFFPLLFVDCIHLWSIVWISHSKITKVNTTCSSSLTFFVSHSHKTFIIVHSYVIRRRMKKVPFVESVSEVSPPEYVKRIPFVGSRLWTTKQLNVVYCSKYLKVCIVSDPSLLHWGSTCIETAHISLYVYVRRCLKTECIGNTWSVTTSSRPLI